MFTMIAAAKRAIRKTAIVIDGPTTATRRWIAPVMGVDHLAQFKVIVGESPFQERSPRFAW